MDTSDNKIKLLEERVSILEVRLEKLTDKHQRDIKALLGCDDIQGKNGKIIWAELEDAFQRIMNIELKLFPQLPKAIRHLRKLIGDGEGKAYNPLDFRDPTKKSR